MSGCQSQKTTELQSENRKRKKRNFIKHWNIKSVRYIKLWTLKSELRKLENPDILNQAEDICYYTTCPYLTNRGLLSGGSTEWKQIDISIIKIRTLLLRSELSDRHLYHWSPSTTEIRTLWQTSLSLISLYYWDQNSLTDISITDLPLLLRSELSDRHLYHWSPSTTEIRTLWQTSL